MLFKYIAGNRICHVLNKSKHILKNGRIPVINYAIESNNNKLLVFKEYEKLCNKLDSNYRIAIKLSSLNFDKNLIKDMIQMYESKNIKILIDAEDNKSNKYLSSGDGMGFEISDYSDIDIESDTEVDFLLFSMPNIE